MRQNAIRNGAFPAPLLVHPMPTPRARLQPVAASPRPAVRQALTYALKLGGSLLVAIALASLSRDEMQMAGKFILCGVSSAVALYASVWLLLLFGANRLRWTGA